MADIRPFTINVPDSALDQLKSKLSTATLPDEVEFSDDTAYGAGRSDIKRLAEYWQNGFDWRAQEAKLNAIPQFTTTINVEEFGDLNIHFIHQRSERPGSIPLLFCHGWPGSFLEATKLLPFLTQATDGAAFHVVAPSLPNFGFSDGVTKKGFHVAYYAECVHKLMLKLGYDKYVSQGGDWGYFVARLVGSYYPDHCLATHVNFFVVRPSVPQLLWSGARWLLNLYSEWDKTALKRTRHYIKEGSGYMWQQNTRPSTLGFAVADSPVALLSWVSEKLRDWTDEYPWTDDEILTWVSIYQFSTAGPAASMRIYYESNHGGEDAMKKAMQYIPRVPIGVSYFPKEVIMLPQSWSYILGPVKFEAEHEKGGHFAAYECPEQLAGDVRVMFGRGGGAFDAVRCLVEDDS